MSCEQVFISVSGFIAYSCASLSEFCSSGSSYFWQFVELIFRVMTVYSMLVVMSFYNSHVVFLPILVDLYSVCGHMQLRLNIHEQDRILVVLITS